MANTLGHVVWSADDRGRTRWASSYFARALTAVCEALCGVRTQSREGEREVLVEVGAGLNQG